ncbi:ribonuclease P/MRP protein subunit POP5, putative [Entamoeba dispar SAW760]|uniref:Ribonuclease P/MRP protein subunit POP5 n=1 Tax=Entamoeba dispar (strain ATCC PRA-260 / SAW760) TaxID=370354 RepID=B0EFM6_ENTDS|nr:ribonuclease P/MRP protein subunit POP5, putative [Entamoeba dispar SAW760]EDR26657.1 ribonuclease P/MRP protein subunit POP5, putative [Entamoeba dispar SAW760]|eukprot:EDR26657.1 ribonuclease P/MRP protein subunit POP5, putative [Entamoeba dispar SAW760]
MVRVKSRYLLIHAVPSGIGEPIDIAKGEFQSLIVAGVRQLYGIFGAGCCLKTGIIYTNWLKTGIVIIKCRFERLDMIKTTMKYFGSERLPFPFKMNVVHVSGTIRSCKREAIKYDSRAII